jgi:two-component system LytT family response regulator
MDPIRIVIIEDEVNNALLIQEMLKKLSFPLEVVGIATEINHAAELILSTQPDLVLLDIMLKGGTGFQVLEKLKDYSCEVIFITAYNQFAIDAIRKRAFDYLLKPVNSTEFLKTLTECHTRIIEKIRVKSLINSNSHQFFSFKTNIGTEVIPLNSILYFEAEGSYTKCATEKNTVIVSKNIGDIEKELPEQLFFRCHHSYLINAKHIKKIELSRSGSIICSNDQVLPISQRKKKEFLDFLKNNQKPG